MFFSDLLYVITHQIFTPDAAEGLWNTILQHKYDMSLIIGRNIRITVAALDELSNLHDLLPAATVISEEQITGIIRLSQCDSLTGLFNHAFCYKKLDIELKRFTRYGTKVSVLMIDLDNFKEFNDLHGHQEGDKVLSTIGATIRGMLRDSDICCRYGGEEFAVILPSTDADEAGILAGRLQAILEKDLIQGAGLTVSIGVAASSEMVSTSQEIVEKADIALYKAKKNGKNQVVISD
ncbi:MAG: hypothetical protein A2487_18365 [Candidatus Raymondbacteria bacterium RifOxyC12_full_50_8]|nr:MAG: hypothetical protein A2487_18365 [Candidatus Raymondbacteria bacterium RifOxyC12_full_50_8]